MAKITLKEKLTAFLNAVSEQVSALEDFAAEDEKEQGTALLQYVTKEGLVVNVDSDGIAKDADGNVVAAGDYNLDDGVLVILDGGKFGGTKEAEGSDGDVEPAVTPIDPNVEQEKVNQVTDVDTGYDPEPSPSIVEPTPAGTTPADTLVPVVINGIEYLVPQEVADYIAELEERLAGITAAHKALETAHNALKGVTPSAGVAQSKVNPEKEMTNANYFVSLLNRRNPLAVE